MRTTGATIRFWRLDLPCRRSATLKTFLAVARCGSFAAAGKEIGLTAAAVGPADSRARRRAAPAAVRPQRPRGRAEHGRPRMVAPVADLVARYEALAAQRERRAARRQAGDGRAGVCADGRLRRRPARAHAPAPGARSQAVRGTFGRLRAARRAAASSTRRSSRSRRCRRPSNLVWTALYDEPMVLIVPRRPHFPVPAEPRRMLAECPFLRFDRQAWTGHLVDAGTRAGRRYGAAKAWS